MWKRRVCGLVFPIPGGRGMIYEQASREPAPHPPHPAMAYNPFLMHRASDYSMSSLLAAQGHYLPGMGLQPHGIQASILPKIAQTVTGRTPLTPADVLVPQSIPRPLRMLEPPESEVHDDPKVDLESKDLWEKFHSFGTEMVITKSGR